MLGIIPGTIGGRRVDIVTNSGMLSATVHPSAYWLAGLVTLVGDAIFAAILYYFWPIAPLSIRVFWIAILLSTMLNLPYEFLGQETIEFDSQKLTIRKGIHGWARKRVYKIEECSNLEWKRGQKGRSYLTCKVRGWPTTFANRVSENGAVEILSALQRTLPIVANKICSSPQDREHFITLGLNKQ